ncbi:hypothetical protein O181_039762 [Austropuccinia psidii MF-1]|uniref:Uncharacterized protein n=1 Tax=Austropuccinia psidii MF-1 TaxID=1389203 RepID=A0A9Q3DDI3_9BASI|nr:hypothetical protein [Austropuccinia psidii MF-1]
MTIIYKEGKSHTNADGLSRWPLDNVKRNLAYDPEIAAKITIHFMEIDRKRNFRFSEWAPESGTPDTDYIGPEETKNHLRIPDLESKLKEHWFCKYTDKKSFLIDGLLYHREKHSSSITVIDRDNVSPTLQELHDFPYMGHMSEDRTKERMAITA